MATEPSINSLVDASASATLESQPINDQNVDSSLLTTDNASKANAFDIKRTSFIDDQPNSADVSISGGSDSEAVRSVGTGPKDGTHNRTSSSTKKLATFKAVNPNKSFLGAKAGSPVPTSKPADRPLGPNTPPTGSATLSSRPRLVAKTGGQKDGVSRLGSLNGGKVAAPSAQAVWNKNRPPEPKKFTDEELKNHGIHMASRLNENDASGQNKWADIDDDDDDWAPEAITWGDGTKTNIPHPDEISPEPINDPRILPEVKPASPAPQVISKLGPSGSGTKGLILKNSHSSTPQEKPALVAKPSASQASKSPWAALPPVDKVSPALPPPPEQKHLFRPGQKDRDGPGPFARGPSTPPHEDGPPEDFGRQSWRDPSAPRELYNTQSGRYEPVPDRRGSYHSMKPSAVLQRPHGSHGDYPAEPSPAFSASRTSHDPPYSRRRGSSIASANSGSFYQKRGSDLPPGGEMLAPRRPSFTGSTDSLISPVSKHVQPYGQPRNQGPPWPSQMSPHLANSSPHQGPPPNMHMGPPPVSSQPQIDQVEYQKKLMKERQELARKRRQEEEAREEAAKRERIQKKLDALGPPPEKKPEKETAASAESGRPIHIQQRPDQAPETGKTSPQEVPQTVATPQDPLSQKSMLPESSSAPAPPTTTPRRPSHGQGQEKRPNIWSGQGPRGDPPGWSRGGPTPARNVWGSPDIDRALGNGTFNPDLGRVPGAVQPPLNSTGPSPIGPPGSRTTSQPRSQQQPAPIGSRAPPRSGTDLATQWVSAVVESDRALVAVSRQRRNDRDAQLAEQGLTVADAQPTIQEAWRPVQLASDGSRRIASSTDASHPPANPWKAPRDDFARDPQSHIDMAPPANPGVIGSGSTAMMSQKSQQGRSSRFFPTQHRPELVAADFGRSSSPTPPPPTMMGHPAYEGDTSRPQVSLPKPQPIVKLPPMLKLASAREAEHPGHGFAWAHQQSSQSDTGSKPNWQTKIHNLFKDAKSPTKMVNVDALSKKSLDLHPQHATVSLPSSNAPGDASGDLRTKPMAEECFEEQEMGSLPQIRFGHYQSDLPLQPVTGLMVKPLPRRLVTQASTVDAFPFYEEITKGTPDMKIQLPGMVTYKTIAIPASLASTDLVSPRGRGGRGGPRSRGQGRGKRDRDTSDAQSVHSSPRASSSSVPNASRGGRGSSSFRGRGGSWRGRGGLDLHSPSPASSLPA